MLFIEWLIKIDMTSFDPTHIQCSPEVDVLVNLRLCVNSLASVEIKVSHIKL